jgi:ABC-type glycerol-3-phosphate transport system substrate-binding protein
MSTLRKVLFIVAALSLLLAACGDDSSGGSTAQSAPTEAADGTIGDVDLGDITGLSDECATVAEASLQAAGAAGAALSPGGDVGDIGSFFDGAADAAPEELRDDFEVLAETFGTYGQVLEDSGADLTDPNSFADPQVVEALQEAVETFSTSEFEDAANNISTWAEANCSPAG